MLLFIAVYSLFSLFEIFVNSTGSVAYLYLNKHVELSELDKEIILKQVQLLYQNIDLANDSFDFIEILEIIISDDAVNTQLNQQMLPILPVSNWNQMRSKLIDIYGINVDRN